MVVDVIETWKTKYSADSVEFCPINSHTNLFVVGTYQLDEKQTSAQHPKGKRLGCLYLHKLMGRNVQTLQEIEMSGILDMKWSCNKVGEKVLLAVVTADGELKILQLIENSLVQVNEVVVEGGALALSLDWSNRKNTNECVHISVSDSNGYINVFTYNEEGLTLKHRALQHEYEAWITAFNYWGTNLLYSGGDDSKFKGYDLRLGLDRAIFTSKVHMAGVTSLHCNDTKEHLLLSGSYDENINLWDDRNMKSSIKEVKVGGGVWRLKWRPHTADKILAASMYNNFHVLNGDTLNVEVSYEAHESIAYGADWHWGEADVIATASFYDNMVSVWKTS